MIGIVQILGGLALFMFGLRLLSSGMEKLAGNQIQKWLNKVTSNRLKSAGFGAVATAVLQSSGLLMVAMIGLINANLMTVQQSIGVMLGQEIGTTITAQIVAFDIGPIRLFLVIFGFILLESFPHKDWKKYGEILMGLGLIFVGMSYMAAALDSLVEVPMVANLLVSMGQQPFIGLLAGLVVTSITQSSTAVTSMVVAMGISHVITLEGAIGVILGANIGSCITGLIAAMRLGYAARQASLAQISMNLFGVLLFSPFIVQFADLISRTSSELPRQIANAHTIFNVTVSAILFPFVKQLGQFAAWLSPVPRTPEKIRVTAYIDEMQLSMPALALNEAAHELTRMGDIAAQMLKDSCNALINLDTSTINSVLEREDKMVDPIAKELSDFVNELMHADLSIAQQKRCFQIKNLLNDIERIGDMAEDIAQFAQERLEHEVVFSSQAIAELQHLWHHAHRTFRTALQAFAEEDAEKARQACRLENEFDILYWQTRQSHIQRLEEGICQPEADVIFTETLRNLERISDHADNLGVSVARSLSHTSAKMPQHDHYKESDLPIVILTEQNVDPSTAAQTADVCLAEPDHITP
jgi:phosphate:Na+ symporter